MSNAGFKDARGSKVIPATRQPTVTGPLLAWNWTGHGALTGLSLGDSRSSIRSLLGPPGELASMVQWVDIHIANIPGWPLSGGQIRHFMRDQAQSEADAYRLSVNWILRYSCAAARILANVYKSLLHTCNRRQDFNWNRYQSCIGSDDATQLTMARRNLAMALHALQDSFSPGHVKRDSTGAIQAIHTWDEENKHPMECWDSGVQEQIPGTGLSSAEWIASHREGPYPSRAAHCRSLPGHEEHDKSWQMPNGELSALGKAVVQACRDLIDFVLEAALASHPETRCRSLITKRLVPTHLRAPWPY